MINFRDEDEGYDLTEEVEEEQRENFIRRCEDLDWKDERNER